MPQHPGSPDNPQGAPVGPAAPPQAPPPDQGAPPPGNGQQQPADAGNELLEPIQQMSDMIVQLGGPEVLAQILQGGLEQLQQQGAEQGPPVLAAPQPVPGGEAFGPQEQ